MDEELANIAKWEKKESSLTKEIDKEKKMLGKAVKLFLGTIGLSMVAN